MQQYTLRKYIGKRLLISICTLHLGHLVETGSKEEIFSNPIHPYTRSLLSAIPHPNPVVEKKRKVIGYDYQAFGVDDHAGTEHNVGGTHNVLATDEELARWTSN